MLLLKGHYSDKGFKEEMAGNLANLLNSIETEPVFLAVGSHRHILDCLGPLTGTMITEKAPLVTVYGTLDEPLNAKNLHQRMELIKHQRPGSMEIAIDASLGPADDLGMIKLFQGSLQPGKALSQRLEPVGHYYITGIVASQEDKPKLGRSSFGSLTHVYHMASLISDAVSIWYNSYNRLHNP
jgi:putative sporulation protein YyaC